MAPGKERRPAANRARPNDHGNGEHSTTARRRPRSSDPSRALMLAPIISSFDGPISLEKIAKYACASREVGVHGCRPCPACCESRRSLLDPSFPVEFSSDRTWKCHRCGAAGGPLSFVVAFLFGEVLPENDPRVEQARVFVRSLRRPASSSGASS